MGAFALFSTVLGLIIAVSIILTSVLEETFLTPRTFVFVVFCIPLYIPALLLLAVVWFCATIIAAILGKGWNWITDEAARKLEAAANVLKGGDA